MDWDEEKRDHVTLVDTELVEADGDCRKFHVAGCMSPLLEKKVLEFQWQYSSSVMTVNFTILHAWLF